MAEESETSRINNELLTVSQQEAIEATGCASLNEQLLLCYDTYRDWRACKPEMKAFRDCYRRFQQSKVHENTP